MNFFIIVLVGFLAQMIDGSLGMAYGVSSTSFLITFGMPQTIASASVHVAELLTTFVSGISHWKMKNIDWLVFKRLVIPGIAGGAVGAFVLVNFTNKWLELAVTVYLIAMGIIIMARAIKTLIIELPRI
jgi:uncharacterized membrane protein YfcA